MAILGATSLTGCNSIPDFIAAGSRMLFEQSTAPTSWTKSTTHNDKALRVVTGTASPAASGQAFTTVFASRAVSGTIVQNVGPGTVEPRTLTANQIPSHTHEVNAWPSGGDFGPSITTTSVNAPATAATPATDGGTGGGASHTHTFTPVQHAHQFQGTSINFAILYVDVIIASKA